MRTSLTDIRDTEKHLQGKLSPEDSIVFQARLLTEPLLRMNLRVQQRIYSLIGVYHRKKLREEAAHTHHKLFTDPSKNDFQKKIFQLFNS